VAVTTMMTTVVVMTTVTAGVGSDPIATMMMTVAVTVAEGGVFGNSFQIWLRN
jgi:hypothetical protein